MDYPVPNFGRDSDIITTFNSLDTAEKIKNYRWRYDPSVKPKPEEPVLYDDN